jgi:crotonobetainyl-CoA:carnitine CoA-transferase CaiB-like acyl-CoA transferase
MTPLSGIVVLDFSRVLSGPYCTMQLADLGARVIKVEQPGRGDDTRAWGPPFVQDESAYFLSINRNKESLALDLKHEAAPEIVRALLARADVVVENFRPGTMARLRLDGATVTKSHPRLVYCSISGFGQTGPRQTEPGYDAMMQAEGGLMSITGAADGPPFRLGVAIADIATGLFAAQGVLAALYARERTGRGQYVDVAMLDSVAALLTYQAGIVFATGTTPARMGNRHPSIAPYDTFSAADGDFVLSVGNDHQFRRLAELLHDPELATDARFATNAARVTNYDALRPALQALFASWTRDRLVRELTAAGVPCGAVRSVPEALADPQIHARSMIVELAHATLGHVRVLGNPLKMSDTPPAVAAAPPTLGQHTRSILRNDVGMREDEIRALIDAGAVQAGAPSSIPDP